MNEILFYYSNETREIWILQTQVKWPLIYRNLNFFKMIQFQMNEIIFYYSNETRSSGRLSFGISFQNGGVSLKEIMIQFQMNEMVMFFFSWPKRQ